MKEIKIGINAPFDLGRFNDDISESDKKSLKKIGDYSNLYKSDLKDKSKYDVILFDSSLDKNKFDSEDSELIYQVNKVNESYRVYTGKFIGSLIINGINLKINTGYSDFFLKRLLDFSNGIFLDNSAIFSENEGQDSLLKMIQYMFLTSLRKSLINGLPKEYKTVKNVDFNVKGNVDIKKYISHLNEIYKGIPYMYRSRKYNNDILSVICKAFSCCDKGFVGSCFPDLKRTISTVKCEVKSNTFNKGTIKKAKSSHLLNTNLYSSYRKTLAYAEMLLSNNGFEPSESENVKQVRGWLIDVADLWELYLYNLIKAHFPNWEVMYQEEIPIYKSLFFARSFMPDIVMKKENKIVIIDAKFKKMDFVNGDVDRSDIQQIHTYYSYYNSCGLDVRFATLIYPARQSPSESKTLDANVFESNLKSRFGVSYVLIGDSLDYQKKNETEFIERLERKIQ